MKNGSSFRQEQEILITKLFSNKNKDSLSEEQETRNVLFLEEALSHLV